MYCVWLLPADIISQFGLESNLEQSTFSSFHVAFLLLFLVHLRSIRTHHTFTACTSWPFHLQIPNSIKFTSTPCCLCVCVSSAKSSSLCLAVYTTLNHTTHKQCKLSSTALALHFYRNFPHFEPDHPAYTSKI